jgi:hypothetical protein
VFSLSFTTHLARGRTLLAIHGVTASLHKLHNDPSSTRRKDFNTILRVPETGDDIVIASSMDSHFIVIF